MMEKPTKKERKKRIKDQNAAAKKSEREPMTPLTPEQQEAIRLIARGLIGLFAASLSKQLRRDEFPEELDT
jgi:hypothetical protein